MKNVGRTTLFIFLLINALFVVMGCGNNGFSTDSIPAASGILSEVTSAYPGVVEVIMPEGAGLCSGSVISSRVVLTAAHCLLTDGVYTVNSSFGSFETSTKDVLGTGAVSDTNDIGVLIFSSNITSNSANIYGLGSSIAAGDSVTLVGFGCTNVTTRLGAGEKRMGTNAVNLVTDFIYLLTPDDDSVSAVTSVSVSGIGQQKIIGDSTQAGTCFGDSGGPLFTTVNGQLEMVGVTHAGGASGSYEVSEFVNVATNGTNRAFLQEVEQTYGVQINGL